MGNLFDYLKEYGQVPFAEKPFNEIDNFIFSQISYLDFGYVISEDVMLSVVEASAKYFDVHPSISSLGLVIPSQIIDLFRILPKYERFADVVLSDYVSTFSDTEQFSAITFHLPTGVSCVAFRGTDDSIVGWKEDFMLCYRDVPAQKEAVRYLNSIGRKFPAPTYVCGHSKGGNLSVYASAKCRQEVQERIVTVFNNDGPGFCGDFYQSDDYQKISKKVIDIVPQGSIVGMLLEHSEEYKIVQSDYRGIFQHDIFSWQIDGDQPLVVDDRTRQSYFFDETLRAALRDMDLEEKKKFVDAFFGIIEEADVKNLAEVPEKSFDLIYQAIRLDKESKKLLRIVLRKFLKGSGVTIKNNLKRRIRKR
ncbi:MAG: DUF2974 domain-containing protein [Clostridia bacterium]|nr:DUF2974 domain-containing protein [Clostridia bacterium]